MGACSSKKSNQQGKNLISEAKDGQYMDTQKYSEADTKIFSIMDLGNIIPTQDNKEPIKFQVKLKNFRLRHVRENYYYFMIIEFPKKDKETKRIQTKLATGGIKVKFFFSEEFEILHEYEKLKELKMKITFHEINKNLPAKKYENLKGYADSTRPLAVLQIDLLTLIIGPEHHDIQLFSPFNQKVGRVNFDSSFIHMSNVKIEIKNATCTVNNLIKRDICLRSKLTASNNNSLLSEYSFPILNSNINVNNKQIVYSWIGSEEDKIAVEKENLTIAELNSSTFKMLIFDTKLEGLKSRSELNKLSSFVNEINGEKFFYKPADILGFTSFNIQNLLSENSDTMTKQSSRFFKVGSTLYKERNSSSFSQADIQVDKGQKSMENLKGLSFNDVQIKEEKEEEIKFQINQNIEKTFCEEIYSNNKVIGKIEGRIEIKNIPLIKQIICGVHSEKGFELTSQYLSAETTNNTKGTSLCKELKSISNETDLLIMKLTENTSLKTISGNNKEKNKLILEHLKEILRCLEFSVKESCKMFSYSSYHEMISSHEIILQTGIRLLEIIDNLELEHKKIAIKIMSAIMNRAELDLSSFINCYISSTDVDYNKKKENIKMFITFNNVLIAYALEKFAKKITDPDVQRFVESILAFSYFRVPTFRNMFLETICANCCFKFETSDYAKNARKFGRLRIKEMKKFATIPKDEIYEISGGETGDDDLEDYVNPIFLTIDWERLFYEKLDLINPEKKADEDIAATQKKLDTTLESIEWKSRMMHKGNGFLGLIKYLVEYIKSKIVVDREIAWEDIPGFEQILFVIVNELKTKNMALLSKTFIDVMNCFVNEPEIINVFFRVIVLNTNANDTNAVFTLFNVLDSFFHSSAKKTNNKLKNNFDYILLRDCITIIKEIDHSLCVSKLLWFLYENSHLINEEYIIEIFNTLLFEGNFYHLFFHWAWQVRHVFFNYFLYILQHRIPEEIRKNKKLQGGSTGGDDDSEFKPRTLVRKHTLAFKNDMNAEGIIINFLARRIVEVENLLDYCYKQNKDPTYKNKFDLKDFNRIYECEVSFDKSMSDKVVIAMDHFKPVYDEFKEWKENNVKKKIKELTYPEMILTELKDDIIEYSEANW